MTYLVRSSCSIVYILEVWASDARRGESGRWGRAMENLSYQESPVRDGSKATLNFEEGQVAARPCGTHPAPFNAIQLSSNLLCSACASLGRRLHNIHFLIIIKQNLLSILGVAPRWLTGTTTAMCHTVMTCPNAPDSCSKCCRFADTTRLEGKTRFSERARRMKKEKFRKTFSTMSGTEDEDGVEGSKDKSRKWI